MASGELKFSERLEAAASIRENGRETCALLREAAELARRVEGAATGECFEVGDDEAGRPRVIVHSTRDDLRRGAPLIFKRLALVPLNGGGK